MIHAAVDDFSVLDHSSISVGAVLGTLALLSSSEGALGVESQVSTIRRYCAYSIRHAANSWSKKSSARSDGIRLCGALEPQLTSFELLHMPRCLRGARLGWRLRRKT